MISEFITIGSLEDPFNEFFVEKIYRKNIIRDGQAEETSHVHNDDLAFKMTGDLDKIPVFFNANETAITIFKIGCDLNLLKTKRQ